MEENDKQYEITQFRLPSYWPNQNNRLPDKHYTINRL